jgi:pyruvate formate lyase activating enzyme
MTPLRSGMQIVSDPRAVDQAVPKRVVTLLRPAPHRHPSVFTHGCNYRCDLCHNWDLTFSSTANALTPAQTVAQLALRPETDKWIGISGGEPTLNRQWLVQTIREIRHVAPHSRIQLDTNASMLTPDYIDELVEAGITDLSPDFKAYRLATFSKISGLTNKDEAQQYMRTVWQAIRHTHVNHADSVFMVVNIPCHPLIHSKSELQEMAAALAALGPDISVSLTELQPAFRSRHYPRLSRDTMETAAGFLEEKGLKRIIIQGGEGIPRAVDPRQLMDSTEDF